MRIATNHYCFKKVESADSPFFMGFYGLAKNTRDFSHERFNL